MAHWYRRVIILERVCENSLFEGYGLQPVPFKERVLTQVQKAVPFKKWVLTHPLEPAWCGFGLPLTIDRSERNSTVEYRGEYAAVD
jgi:hypothetical protein